MKNRLERNGKSTILELADLERPITYLSREMFEFIEEV